MPRTSWILRNGVGALAIAAALGFCAVAGAQARTPVIAGAASYGLVASNTNFMPANHALAYQRLYAAGVRAVRLDFFWTSIEQRRGVYDFTERDHEVAMAKAAGLQVIGVLDYGNPLYSTIGSAAAQLPTGGGLPPFGTGAASVFPPDDPLSYARFAAATAQHFRGRVAAWEIWNEENQGWRFWSPHEDPAAYGRLLCAAHDAIRTVDSRSKILFGGVFYPGIPTTSRGVAGAPGMSGPDFVEGAYHANPQLGRCFDVMAYHPYTYPFTSPEVDVPIRRSALAAANGMRSAMPDPKPLWITEVGWPTHAQTYGVNETKQAEYTARMALASFAQGVPVVTYYTYGDDADPTGGANQEAWFGFFRVNGTAKPAYTALQTLTRTLDGTRFSTDLSSRLGMPAGRSLTGGRGFALRYRAPRRDVTAVWLANESAFEGQGPGPDGGTVAQATLTVRVPAHSAQVTLVSMLGARRVVATSGGAVTVTASAEPVYVVDRRVSR